MRPPELAFARRHGQEKGWPLEGEERRGKRGKRRAKREERGGRREERREKTEERPKEAARGPQMRPPEVPPEGGTAQKRVGP